MMRIRTISVWMIISLLLTGCGVADPRVADQPATATVTPTPHPTTTAGPTATSTLPRLRDLWPTPAANVATTGYLYYSAVERVSIDPPERVNTFWRVPLDDLAHPEKITDLDNRPVDGANAGQLSPDGAYIAYAWRTFTSDMPDLRVMRRDGSAEWLVKRWIGNGFSRCTATFAWSPDSTRLAFVDHGPEDPFEPFDDALVLYDLATDTLLPPFPNLGWAEIIAWEDSDHVLLLIAANYEQPRTIERLDLTTGTRTVLSTLPAIEGVYCVRASPDQRYVQLSLNSGAYLFDLDTGQVTRVAIAVAASLWSADSRLLLQFPHTSSDAPQLLPMDQGATPVVLHLTAPGPDPNHSMRIEGTSPDGRYVAVCAVGETGPLRLLLYDIPRDHWAFVTEGPRCARVLGWTVGE